MSVSGDGEDLVTIICDNGKVRISKFLLASLYNILQNLVQSLEESSTVLLKGLQREELRLIFHKLLEQVTQFESEENNVISKVTNHEDEFRPEEIEANNDKVGIDSVLYYITEDHDYEIPDIPPKEKEEPIVIPFNKFNKVNKTRKPRKKEPNQRKKYTPKLVKCDLCDEMIPGGKLGAPLNNEHMSRVHGYEMAQCPICRRKLLKINLDAHVNKIHARCPICEKILDSNNSNHIKRCEKWQKLYGNNAFNYIADIELDVDKSLNYPCPHCGKIKQGRRLKEHMKYRCSKNPGIKLETCGICGHISRNRSQHQAHIRNVHGEKKKKEILKSVCTICGKLVMSSVMKQHLMTHEIRELKYKCELCEKLFVDQKQALLHTRTVHKEKSACPHCGVMVRQLKRHIRSAHIPDAEKRHQCQDCGKGFIDKSDLRNHRMNVHLKLKPYSCRYGCDISYNDTSNRNSHEKKKHGKLFITEREKKLREKIEFLGLDADEDLLSAPIV